ncbi:MAG: LytR C-terminal domain-containing protein [candidate division Zixibacteria bacterium]|nr:LytR C-terminal domain-containing protein [candidate division Zixibacteria bacterium]
MLKNRRRASQTAELQNQSNRKLSRTTLLRIFDVCLLVGVVLVVVYGAVFAVRISTGYAAVEASPDYRVRLQIVDASGQNGGASQLSKALDGWSNGVLEVEVVERLPFDGHTVGETFVVSRQEDQQAARLLAEALGLDESVVAYRPLEYNRQLITATLVVGTGYAETMMTSLTSTRRQESL